MKSGLFILGLFISVLSFGQGVEPSQIQGSTRFNDILQAKNMYIDEYGDTLYIYQHTDINGLITNDSIFLRNDTIFLKNGSGFVKIPTVGGGSPQDLFPHSTGFILSNPTIPLQDTVIFQYTSSVIGTPPSGCNCGILDIPNLQTALDGKALISHTHTIPNITGLQEALDAKENSFTKGNIIQGTGVTITGTLTNRLVGSGDVTINAAGGGVTLSEAINGSIIIYNITTTALTLSLAAGTYKLDCICTIYNETGASNNFGLVLRNNTTSTNLFSSATDINGGSSATLVAARNITIGTTNTIVVQATTAVDAAILPDGCILTALKIN